MATCPTDALISMSQEKYNVLLVEDNDDDALFVEVGLADIADTKFELTRVRSLAEAVAAIPGGGHDLVLLDLGLPDSTGLDTVDKLFQGVDPPAVVVITAMGDDSLRSEAVYRGAQDFIAKGRQDPDMLMWVIRSAVERHKNPVVFTTDQ